VVLDGLKLIQQGQRLKISFHLFGEEQKQKKSAFVACKESNIAQGRRERRREGGKKATM